MMKKNLLFLILFLALEVHGCPPLPVTTPTTTWRVSWDISGGNIYFEHVNDNSGYYVCTGVNLAEKSIIFGFYSPTGTMITTPSPVVLGVQPVTDGSYTLNGSSIIGTSNSYDWTIYGIATTTATNIRGFTVTIQGTYDYFALSNYFMYPLHGENYCNTCLSYGSTYPCNSGCTGACYGPAAGMCCDPSCSSCFGSSNSTCNTCNNGYYLSSTTTCSACDPSCPHTCYSAEAGMCCDLSCSSCDGPLSTNCTVCFPGYYLSNGNCLACNSACATCTNSGTSSCLSCNSGYFLQPSPNLATCLTTCPSSGHYPNTTTHTCDTCSFGCATCTASGNGACPTCISGYYLSSTTTCSACSSPCDTCITSNSLCQSCDWGYYLSGTTCLACNAACDGCTTIGTTSCYSCNWGYYLSGTTCLACNAACDGCRANGTTSCYSCNWGYFLQPYPHDTTCSTSCPSAYYKDTTANTCLACNSACATCTASDTSSCQSCNPGYYLSSTTTCSACNSACATCTASGTSSCQSCNPGYYLSSTTTCSACNSACATCTASDTSSCKSCNPGYYLSSTTTCSACNSACATCKASGTSSCQSCNPGYYLSSTTTCSACNSACATCTASDTSSCKSCNPGYFLQPLSTTCSSSCPSAYYKDTTANTCDACNSACATCTASDTSSCQSCNPGYYLSSTTTCSACNSACATCTASGTSSCQSCNPGYYLSSTTTCSACNSACATCKASGTSSCQSCNPGYYLSSTTTCSACNSACATCKASGTSSCQSCNPGYYLSSTTTCSACNSACATCTASDTSSCKSCNPGYFLQPLSTICLSTCPYGYSADISSNTCGGWNLFVDADLTDPINNSYPSLVQALNASVLYVDYPYYLINPNITITLKNSCLTIPQTFPPFWDIGEIYGFSGAPSSLLIQYELTPTTVNDPSICDSLPILHIGEDYNQIFSSISNLTFIGLNIQFWASIFQMEIIDSQNVLFSNFCFNNSEPAGSTGDFYYQDGAHEFDVFYVTNFSMVNGVYIHDGLKTLRFMNVSQITVDSMVFIKLATEIETIYAALNVTNEGYFDTNISITRTQVYCPEIVFLPMIFSSQNINTIKVSGFNLSNSDMNASSTVYRDVLKVLGANYILMDNFTITNITYGMNNYHTIGRFSGVRLTFSNIQISNYALASSTGQSMLFFIEVQNPSDLLYYSMPISFSNLTLNNCSLALTSMMIVLDFNDVQDYCGLIFENVSVVNCSISTTTQILLLEINSPNDENTMNLGFPSIILSNITFSGNIIGTSTVLSFTLDGVNSVEGVEPFHMQISNMILINNNFSDSTLIQADGYATSLSNLVSSNNTFARSSSLYLSNTIVSTFFLTDSQFEDITLSDKSGIIIANMTASRDLKIELSYNDNGTGIFAETRPFIVCNNTFTRVIADSSSILLSSTNPMVIIQNNIFQQITLSNSKISELGRYPNFVSSGSYYENWDDQQTYSVTDWPMDIHVFGAAETSIFRESAALQQIYNKTRENIQQYDDEGAIFFINFQDNVIDTLISSGNAEMIVLDSFQIDNSTVLVINNSFFSISIDVNTNYFDVNLVTRLIAINNAISGTSISGYYLSLSTTILKTLILDSNTMTNVNNLGKYLVEAVECTTILINNDTDQNNEITTPFISISCDSIDSQVILQNSNFTNITQMSTDGILGALNLISITTTTRSVYSDSQIIFVNNNFQGISVIGGEEDFTTGIFPNSFIFVLAIGSTLTLENNTFHTISVTPQGNIFTISIPTIYFIDTTFSNFQFWDVNGAFNMVFYNLSAFNCSFEANIGLNFDGVGLMKFTNPSPSTTALNVLINNCTFEKNIGPYGAILSTRNTGIQMYMNATNLLNSYVTESGGLLQFYNISNSRIDVNNCIFQSDDGYLFNYPALQVFLAQNPGEGVSLTVNNSIMTIGDELFGYFVQVTNQQKITFYASNFTLTSSPNSIGSANAFAILVADNVDANLDRLVVSNLLTIRIGLFVLDCNLATNLSHLWNLEISNSSFTNIQLHQGLIVINSDEFTQTALNNLTILIQNSSFTNIDWGSNTGGIITSTTSLIGKSQGSDFAITVVNSTFQHLSGTQGLIYNGVESWFDQVLWLNQSTFEAIAAVSEGALINPASTLLSTDLENGTLRNVTSFQMTNCNVSSVVAQDGGIFFWESNTQGVTILLENNTFENIALYGNGGLFAGAFQVSTVNQTMIPSNFVTLQVKKCSFQSISVQNGGVFYSTVTAQLLNISFENCTFEFISSAQSGGVLTMFSSAVSNASETLGSNLRVLQGTSQALGNVTVTNSNFNFISAQNGGVLYELTFNKTLSILLQNNTFLDLSSTLRGGVLFLNQPVLSVQSNVFNNCTANIAGEIIYSLSDKMNLNTFNSTSTTILNSSSPLAFASTNLKIEFIPLNNISQSALIPENYQNYSTNPVFLNLTSYSLTEYTIRLTLIYFGNQGFEIVPDESINSFVTMVFTDQNTQKSQTHSTNDCTNSICQVAPTDIVLSGKADDTFLVNVTYTSGIYTQFQQFSIILRACMGGEINDTSTGECTLCGYGTYSFNLKDTQCKQCPIGAICEGGSNTTIIKGYYRSENTTDLYVLPCNDSGARCLGGNNTCSEQYTGPLCSQCDDQNRYLKYGTQGECSKCYGEAELIITGTLLLLSSMVYQLVMVIVTYKENRKSAAELKASNGSKELQPGAFMVILTTFTQIFSTICNFSFGPATFFLNLSLTIGNANSQAMFSLQCLYYLSVPNPFQALRFEMMLYVFSPIIKTIVVIIFELIRGLIWRDKEGKGGQNALVRIGAVAVVLILLEQPAIIGTLCQYLNCSQLDPHINEYYITDYNNIQCYTDDYYEFRNILVFPGLMFWGLVVPIAIFLILRAKRKILYTSQPFKIVFGNFYNGYNPDAYYWGILIMNFKMAIFMLNSILTTSQMIRGLVYMCLVHLYHMLFKWKPPYNNRYLNRAENFCSVSYMIILTVFFIELTVEDLGVESACNIIILLTAGFAGGYIVLNIGWLALLNVVQLFYKFKMSLLNKRILKETLEKLARYHQKTPNRRDEWKRRYALSLDLPPRLRQTEEYETKRRKQMQKRKLETVKQKFPALNGKIRRSVGMRKKSQLDISYNMNESQDALLIGPTAPITTHIGTESEVKIQKISPEESSHLREDDRLKFTQKKKVRPSRAIEENGHDRRSTFIQPFQNSLNGDSRGNDRSPSRMISQEASRLAQPSQISLHRDSRRNDRSPSRLMSQEASRLAQPSQISLHRDSRRNDRSPSRMMSQEASRLAQPSQISLHRDSRRKNRSPSRITSQDTNISDQPSQTPFNKDPRRGTEAPRRNNRSPPKTLGQDAKLNFIQEFYK